MMRKSASRQSHQPCRKELCVVRDTVFNVEVHVYAVDRPTREPDADEEGVLMDTNVIHLTSRERFTSATHHYRPTTATAQLHRSQAGALS